jgi:glycine cleavage system H protein
MSNLKFTKDHEWVRIEGDIATVGLTDYAQEQLGDIVFVELPDVGRQLEKGGEAVVIESVKAAGELYAPAAGEVTAVNESLGDDPAQVNSDPMGGGWFLKMRIGDLAELDELMDEAAYKALLDSLD